jgi:hypothetical protein
MEHNKYPKVHRLGKPNTEGLLESGTLMYFEKIDGSNGSFRIENGEFVVSSHNRILDNTPQGDNCGFYKWANDNINKDLLAEGFEFYGEWLDSNHTVKYEKDNYNKFYLYDIVDLESDTLLNPEIINYWAKVLGLTYLPPLYVGEYKGLEHLKSIAEQKSALGENQMEGIVIKNYDFTNRFGKQCHGKYVNEVFAEDTKQKKMKIDTEDYTSEHDIVSRFVNEPRLKKMIEKTKELYGITEIDMTLMKYIPKLILEDVFAEESYAICTEYDKVNFKQLKKIVPKRVAYLLTEYIKKM